MEEEEEGGGDEWREEMMESLLGPPPYLEFTTICKHIFSINLHCSQLIKLD